MRRSGLLAGGLVLLGFAGVAGADEIVLETTGYDKQVHRKEILEVLVVSQKPREIVFFEMGPKGRVQRVTLKQGPGSRADERGQQVDAGPWELSRSFADRDSLGSGTARVTVLPRAEQVEMVKGWARTGGVVIAERRFGPPLTLVGCAVRYPLPTNVNYLVGAPRQEEGPYFFVGPDAATASPFYFAEVASVEIGKDGLSVKVAWKNGTSSEGKLLAGWQYDKHRGAPPVLEGFDAGNLRPVELPMRGLKKLTFEGEGQSAAP
jgi:hypothetical protein